jgi:hypothetical protein
MSGPEFVGRACFACLAVAALCVVAASRLMLPGARKPTLTFFKYPRTAFSARGWRFRQAAYVALCLGVALGAVHMLFQAG